MDAHDHDDDGMAIMVDSIWRDAVDGAGGESYLTLFDKPCTIWKHKSTGAKKWKKKSLN